MTAARRKRSSKSPTAVGRKAATRKTAKAKRPARDITDAEVAKLARAIMRAPALLTKDQFKAHERLWGKDDGGITRRVALIALTVSGAELIKSARKGDRATGLAFAEITYALGWYIDRLKALLEILDAAETRLMLAVASREDGEELRQEAMRRAQTHAQAQEEAKSEPPT